MAPRVPTASGVVAITAIIEMRAAGPEHPPLELAARDVPSWRGNYPGKRLTWSRYRVVELVQVETTESKPPKGLGS
jgi:hypothetical protein